jgi:hypothetical protein
MGGSCSSSRARNDEVVHAHALGRPGGARLDRHSLNGPTSSFFLVSTEIVAVPVAGPRAEYPFIIWEANVEPESLAVKVQHEV